MPKVLFPVLFLRDVRFISLLKSPEEITPQISPNKKPLFSNCLYLRRYGNCELYCRTVVTKLSLRRCSQSCSIGFRYLILSNSGKSMNASNQGNLHIICLMRAKNFGINILGLLLAATVITHGENFISKKLYTHDITLYGSSRRP